MDTSKIYCEGGEGSLLHTIQMAAIFKDSKAFVDMRMLSDPQTILNKFKAMMMSETSITNDHIAAFVKENFSEEEGLEEWSPGDWKLCPQFLTIIKNDKIRDFAEDLNKRWPLLGRRMKEDIDWTRTSLLYLPNPVVVPGGRFREVYYWDSYWIIRGLLVCGMSSTARGMIENLLFLVNKIGFVPNGGRVYYTRSQPPLLAAMVRDYVAQTGDVEWGRRWVEVLEVEMKYWMENHAVEVGGGRVLYRYCCEEGTPRPESYREDYCLGKGLGEEDRKELFRELRTGAETGWDFSSRWFIAKDGGMGELKDTRTRFVIPVELNAFLAMNAGILANFRNEMGQAEIAEKWRSIQQKLMCDIEDVLWSEEDGIWYDFDLVTKSQRKNYSASNFVPLWAGIFPEGEGEVRGSKAAEYLEKKGVLEFPGGLPVTLADTGEQWDWPNVWPPMEYLVIVGLRQCGQESLAKKMAVRRIEGCYKMWRGQGHMYEKFDCRGAGVGGGGGEYEVQLGFGWTNGQVLDLINIYKDSLDNVKLD